MKTNLYFIKCLTNLHVGSGDVNYSVVDRQVETDPITGDPIIHASGIKGSLRDAFTGDAAEEARIFGKSGDNRMEDSTGAYKFFDARFICRPLRARGSRPSVNVTTVAAINDLIDLTSSFGIHIGIDKIKDGELSFDNVSFYASEKVEVEGEKTEILPEGMIKKLSWLLGDHFAIAKSLDDYPLPVIARNKLNNGKSENLWYEEYVPHGSLFALIVLTPDGEECSSNVISDRIVQLGANASVGYGYCKFEKFE